MKFKMIVAAFACCLFLNVFSGEVLYWMVDDAASVHYGDGSSVNIQTLVPDSFDTSLASRVRVSGNSLTEDVFLNIYIGDGETFPGDYGVDFGDPGSGHWGCGVPTGNQSPLKEFTGPEFSFMIELGNYSYDETTDVESWTTIARSVSQSYTTLSKYVYYQFDISPPTTGIWNPHDFYAVPEPSSGIMLAFGIAILLLRRNNRTSGAISSK